MLRNVVLLAEEGNSMFINFFGDTGTGSLTFNIGCSGSWGSSFANVVSN
jgi:hypothetical protein